MRRKSTLILLLSYLVIAVTTSCEKDNNTTEVKEPFTASVEIEFDHLAGGRKIVKDTPYKNALQQDFTVQSLKYFVSNIKLVKADGSTYVVPQAESYFLIDAFGENTVELDNIPDGSYNKVIFTLGVDSERSKAPVEQRTGVLDPEKTDMYWSWNSGYRFLSIEGESSFATSVDKRYRYHIGGYGGYNVDSPTLNNIKVIEVDLTKKEVIALLEKDKKSQVHLFVHVDNIFNGETNIDIAAVTTIHGINATSALIANNYTKLFVHDHTHNNVAVK